MSVSEAAREMGVSERTVLHRIAGGIIQAQRLGARSWLVPESEVERLRGQGRLKTGPKSGSKRRKRKVEP